MSVVGSAGDVLWGPMYSRGIHSRTAGPNAMGHRFCRIGLPMFVGPVVNNPVESVLLRGSILFVFLRLLPPYDTGAERHHFASYLCLPGLYCFHLDWGY